MQMSGEVVKAEDTASAKAPRLETPEGSQRGSRLGKAGIMVADQERFWVG